MVKFYKIIILYICFLVFLGFSTDCIYAQTAKELFNKGIAETAIGTGHNEIQENPTLPSLVGRILQVLLSFVGVIFLLLMIYGGYIWMMARGNAQDIEKAQKIIKMAIIGILIVASAYGITTLFGRIVTDEI